MEEVFEEIFEEIVEPDPPPDPRAAALELELERQLSRTAAAKAAAGSSSSASESSSSGKRKKKSGGAAGPEKSETADAAVNPEKSKSAKKKDAAASPEKSKGAKKNDARKSNSAKRQKAKKGKCSGSSSSSAKKQHRRRSKSGKKRQKSSHSSKSSASRKRSRSGKKSGSGKQSRSIKKSRKRSRSAKHERSKSHSRSKSRSRSRKRSRSSKSRRSRSRSSSAGRRKGKESPEETSKILWSQLMVLSEGALRVRQRSKDDADGGFAKREMARKQRRLEMKIREGLRGESLKAAAEILQDEGALEESSLLELLELSASKPGIEPFAQTLVLCAAARLRLDIPSFAKVLGLLVYREAPASQVRVLLNLLIPKEAPPLPVTAPGLDLAEARETCEDLEAGNRSDAETKSDSRTPPQSLTLSKFQAHPELNGVFELNPDMTAYGRPTYERREEPRAVVYYRRRGKDTGWCVGTSLECQPLGFNSRESQQPPRTGWHICGNSSARSSDPAFFITASPSAGAVGSKSVPGMSAEKCQQALERVDLRALQGSVEHKDQATLDYFAHFCVLAHLEYLAESMGIRRRRRKSSLEQLVRTGWALAGMPVKTVFGRRDGGGGKKPLPGWQDCGTEMVAFIPPPGLDAERVRFSRGDCVTLSEQDPFKDRVAEGTITSVNPWAIVVQLSGRMPEGHRSKTWRLDKAANRVIYERTLTALLQLATDGKQPKINEMLVAAKVGEADSHVDAIQAGARSMKDGDLPRAAQIAAEAPKGVDQAQMEKCRGEIKELALNRSQQDAVTAALERTCTVIQGPPGTGKTHVSVQVLRLVSKLLGGSGPLLAASDSNCAVDNIAVGLQQAGVRAVRVGRPEKVRGNLDEITLEALLRKEKEKKDHDEKPIENVKEKEKAKEKEKVKEETEKVKEKAEVHKTDGVRDKDSKWDKECVGGKGENGAWQAHGDLRSVEPWAAKGKGYGDGWDADAQGWEEAWGGKGWDERWAAAATWMGGGYDGAWPAKGKGKGYPDAWAPYMGHEESWANGGWGYEEPWAAKGYSGYDESWMTQGKGWEWPSEPWSKGKGCETPWAAKGKQAYEAPWMTKGKGAQESNATKGNGPRVIEPPARQEAVVARTPIAAKGSFTGKNGKNGGGKRKGEQPEDLEMDHMNRQRDRREDFELQMKILREAEVVCTTTIAAGGEFFSKINFAAILIDEVAQATELSAIVPIVLRGGSSLKRLILVGDHCQLPPGIASQEAKDRGLSLSIYKRLQNSHVQPMFLDTQYRSHPKVMEFSSEGFYDGKLKSGIDAKMRPIPKGISWPNKSVPVAFFEVGSMEESEGDSKINSWEADRVVSFVQEVLSAKELEVNDIGIVTPYSAQVRKLRMLARGMIPPGTNQRALEIASVDAFQGREKELIVFSAVRNNPGGQMGFLADWRRLNVMLTRARRGLVVFGSAATLRKDPYWQKWLAWCERNGAMEASSMVGQSFLTNAVQPQPNNLASVPVAVVSPASLECNAELGNGLDVPGATSKPYDPGLTGSRDLLTKKRATGASSSPERRPKKKRKSSSSSSDSSSSRRNRKNKGRTNQKNSIPNQRSKKAQQNAKGSTVQVVPDEAIELSD